MRIGILASHPIQYQAPLFRRLAQTCALKVFFAHQPSPLEQSAGFGGAFEWDTDLLAGYGHTFLRNRARRPSSSKFFGCDTPELSRIIAESHFDAFIVSGWNLKTYWQAVPACRSAGVPVLVRGDSQLTVGVNVLKKATKNLVYPSMLRYFDGFLSVGKRNREYLLQYGVPDDRIFFVPHCVDNDWFADRARRAERERCHLRARWGATDKSVVALFVGKFIAKKRPLDFLRAVDLFNDTKVKIRPVFVGSGELEPELRTAAHELRIGAVFEGFKNQTELPPYYAASDVLVLPSDARETWGLVVNESMACGRPAIVSDAVGCAPDLIDDGQTGFTYPVANVKALAERLVAFANLRQKRFEFASPIAAKMRRYSVSQAAEGAVQAVESTLLRLTRHRVPIRS